MFERIMKQSARRQSESRQGAMLILVAIMLVVLLAMTAMSIDIAYMQLVRTELRTASDAAARAASSELIATQDVDLARQAARNAAGLNLVAGQPLELADGDIEFGESQPGDGGGKFTFVANAENPNAVRINGRRDDGSVSGTVPLFMGPITGTDQFKPVMISAASGSVRDIALVLDRSGSMQIRDAGGGLTRNQALINAVNAFITEIEATSPNTSISLTTYSTDASLDIGLTTNLNAVRASVNQLPAAGFTNIFQGLRLGSDSLEGAGARPFAERTVVVMTDGNFNVGGTPIPSANVAAARDHIIHAITFSPGANQVIMRQVADIGGGLHIHADDAGDLSEAFQEIARTIANVLIE